MTRVNIKARIRRNKLDELAGVHYRDENAEIVKFLNSTDKKALVGIQREDGVYTIIGDDSIYYSTPLGMAGEIPQGDFLVLLRENALRLGKTGNFEFININEQDMVWLKDAPTMSAMWNTIRLLHDSKH